MTNKLYVGFTKTVKVPEMRLSGYSLRRRGLLIDDEVRQIPRAKIFDPLKHSFNPVAHLGYKEAREIADVLYTVSPQGENTLTVRNGKRALLRALLDANRLDRVRGDEEVTAMIEDILMSPVLKRVFCGKPNFTLTPRSMIVARINRAELGDFDALVLGLLLMAHYKGQVIIPDFGFYGREAHVSLIRENRLIAGVNTLAELPVKLRQAALLIKDKEAAGATAEDAETLAIYARHAPGTVGFRDFVSEAMS
jgi:hypothetical protein